MGGRIALEVAFRAPELVRSLTLLAPSMAWTKMRQFVPLVRLLRPELASIPHPMRAATVQRSSGACSPTRRTSTRRSPTSPPTSSAAPTDSRAARVAFFAALRNIYLDEPYGHEGFWSRLAELEPPALFIWGDADKLVPASFARHVAEALPSAEQIVLTDCGHVPQVELAERTNRLIRDHVAAASRLPSPTKARLRRDRWLARARSAGG